jgi:hypothetical protein
MHVMLVEECKKNNLMMIGELGNHVELEEEE